MNKIITDIIRSVWAKCLDLLQVSSYNYTFDTTEYCENAHDLYCSKAFCKRYVCCENKMKNQTKNTKLSSIKKFLWIQNEPFYRLLTGQYGAFASILNTQLYLYSVELFVVLDMDELCHWTLNKLQSILNK